MKVTTPSTYDINTSEADRSWESKELVHKATLVIFDKASDCIYYPVQAKWYTGRNRNASRVYCIVYTPAGRCTGWAGGGGYDKQATSLANALFDAGYRFDTPIDGGWMQTQEAMIAIAEFHRYTGISSIV